MTIPYGASVAGGQTHFRVRAPRATALWLCLFARAREERHPMRREGDDWIAELPGDLAGQPYGYRAEGEWAPERGLWFDPAKLLVDPHALELDRRFIQSPLLAQHGAETAAIVPRALVPPVLPEVPLTPPHFARGGLIYELNVRAFTMLHGDVPEAERGTVAALAHPSVIAHLRRLHVSAVELMPITACIDERHLPPLGLRNAWGYNPVAPMALDPGLCPGGVAELRRTVAALHAAGIGVILDLVLNHTGESDAQGGVLCLRGLDDAAYAKAPGGALINDTGCGNTLDFAEAPVRELALATLRHFVRHCGVDGFRFDLATVMARGPGFDPDAPIFAEIAADPWLADRVLIAEPWDIGPGGYQLGRFPAGWLEWNDRYRDDVRRFWRGDGGVGALATRMAGSSDLFGGDCRGISFLAAHDGFTLADSVAYAHRHNHANGEDNRDGHGENFSWNNGAEGPSDDPAIAARRTADLRALLATLFASAGTIMLTAGDEFGRSQQGNNNAYAQDNELTWIDWQNRDRDLEDYVAGLAAWRSDRIGWFSRFAEPGEWTRLDGAEMTVADWENGASAGLCWRSDDPARPLCFTVDRADRSVTLGASRFPSRNGRSGLGKAMVQPRILVTRRLPEVVETRLRASWDVTLNPDDKPLSIQDLSAAFAGFDVLLPTITDRLDSSLLTPDARVRLIANFGAGVEHVDLPAARASGIAVTNTPDALTETTAELALTLMLMAARRAGEGERLLRAGKWQGWGPTAQLGQGLAGKRLGLVGFGRIARATARRAKVFGMEISYFSRSAAPAEVTAELAARRVDTLAQLAAEADVLSLHTPGGKETRHLVDAALLVAMKPGAILINTARGSVVDEAALADALAARRIAAAGLDVYEAEPQVHPALLGLENVVLLPHLGSATLETRTAMGMQAVDNIAAFLSGRELPNRVA